MYQFGKIAQDFQFYLFEVLNFEREFGSLGVRKESESSTFRLSMVTGLTGLISGGWEDTVDVGTKWAKKRDIVWCYKSSTFLFELHIFLMKWRLVSYYKKKC